MHVTLTVVEVSMYGLNSVRFMYLAVQVAVVKAGINQCCAVDNVSLWGIDVASR